MKKICILLVAIITMTSAKAQDFTYAELKEYVDEYNSQMPMSVGPSMEYISASLSATEFILVANLAEYDRDLDQSYIDQIKSNVLVMMSSEDDKWFYSSLVKLNISFRIVYFGRKSGKTADVVMTPDDMRQIIYSETTPQDRLNAYIAGVRNSLPLDLGEIIFTDIRISGKFVEFTYQCSQELVNAVTAESIKVDMQTTLPADEAASLHVSLCVEAGYGIAVIYTSGNSSVRGQLTKQELIDLGIYE